MKIGTIEARLARLPMEPVLRCLSYIAGRADQLPSASPRARLELVPWLLKPPFAAQAAKRLADTPGSSQSHPTSWQI